jgi:hypothetical protein
MPAGVHANGGRKALFVGSNPTGRARARSKLSSPVAAMPVSSNERNEAPIAGCRWNYI